MHLEVDLCSISGHYSCATGDGCIQNQGLLFNPWVNHTAMLLYIIDPCSFLT